MTVSDVVEFIDTEENSTFYFCDRYGFTEIDFMPNEAMKPIRNHNYICETQVINESVVVVFDDIDGYTDRFSKKVILSRCQYSDNQLGYMLQVLTDDKFYEICYLNRPKVLITKNIIPSTVLWKRNIDGFVERRYNEHDIQNLIAIEQWLRDENKWCYYL